MAVSENTGGAQAATPGTEHTLATITTAGTYQLMVEVDTLADGEELELRIKVKGRSGSSSRVAFFHTIAHAQGTDAEVVLSPPVPAPHEFIATLKQIGGSSRTFDWAIYEY